jgi:RiboL-PSP-HEPN
VDFRKHLRRAGKEIGGEGGVTRSFMPSQANINFLVVLLKDAEELLQAHRKLKTGKAGRQWGLGAINRACVVMCVSAWEAYAEELVKEAVEKMKPAAAPIGAWPALNALARSKIGSFNNPNPEKVKSLFADSIGLDDITVDWYWRKCSQPQAVKYLQDILKLRHHIAHGVKPRPLVDNTYAEWLPDFFRRLGQKTDATVKIYLTTSLGLPAPW